MGPEAHGGRMGEPCGTWGQYISFCKGSKTFLQVFWWIVCKCLILLEKLLVGGMGDGEVIARSAALLRRMFCQKGFCFGICITGCMEDMLCFLGVYLAPAYMYDIPALSVKIGVFGLALEFKALRPNGVTQELAGDHRVLSVPDCSKHTGGY